jgi:F1F0 ATPase subunit 2
MFSFTTLLIPFVLGGLIGWVYFGGLWETVRRLPESKNPQRLMILSFAARTLFALGGFFMLTEGQWERMVAAIAGFFIVKSFLVRSFGVSAKSSSAGAVSWKS